MRRVLLWTAGTLVVLAGLTVLAFKASPWPTVALIQYMFSKGDTASEAALERHVPPGIVTEADIAYGPGPDDRFDLFRAATAPRPAPAVVWVHGGAWVAGSKAGVSNYLRVLAGEGFTTIAVEYSTGYGTTYPRSVEQVNAALGYLVANAAALGIDPARLVLAGDSAGAQLAAQVTILTRDADYARRLGIAPAVAADAVAGLVLVSGAYDLESIDLDGDMGWFLRAVLWAYSGVRDFMSDERLQLASVAQHIPASFPPTIVTSGNGDPLEPQARRLVGILEAKGLSVDSLFFPPDTAPALPHEYQFNLDTAAGQEAFSRLVAFLRERVD